MNGKVIRALRRARDMRQVDLASAANVDVGLLSKIEHNLGKETPGVAAAKTRILKVLGMCPSEGEQR